MSAEEMIQLRDLIEELAWQADTPSEKLSLHFLRVLYDVSRKLHGDWSAK
jgi:hypothetical protein